MPDMKRLGPRPPGTTRLAAILLCVLASGCAGPADDAGSPDTGTSDVCAALARFGNAFQATTDAVRNGGDTNEVFGSVSTLKEQAISLAEALQDYPKAAAPLTEAVKDLTDAAARLPHDATEERVTTVLEPRISAVADAVDEAETSLECPS